MQETETKFTVGDSTECINCGATIFKWFDTENQEEYWATDMDNSLCNRSSKQHVPMGF